MAAATSDEDERLRRNAEPAFLPEKQKRRRKIRERIHAARDRFGESAKERERAERDDERRQAQPGDERGVQSARQRADAQRARRRHRHRQARVAPQFAEQDRAQPEQRADRQIDAARENDRRHHQREQADLDRVADDRMFRATEVFRRVETEPFRRDHEEQNVRQIQTIPAIEHERVSNRFDAGRRTFVCPSPLFDPSFISVVPGFICSLPASQSIRHDGQQDDRALNRLFPIRLDVQMRQRRADAREQQQADEHAPQIAAPAGDRHAARRPPRRSSSVPSPVPDFGSTCGDCATFIIAASPVSAPMKTKVTKRGELRTNAREPRRFGVRADRVNEPPGGEMFRRERQQHEQHERDGDERPLTGRWLRPNHCTPSGRFTNSPCRRQRTPSRHVDHRRERDDDGRQTAVRPRARR